MIEENNQDFVYFYQASTGENLFLHNISLKLFHQEFNQDFKKYPLRIESKIEEIEHDILDIAYSHKKLKYMSHLPDTTPFGLVEINMQKFVDKDKIISQQVYQDNFK